MTLGLLPALGGGLTELATTGQAGRLLDGYLARYVKVFDRVFYFSYRVETLEQFSRDPALLAHARVIAPARPLSRGRRAATLAWTESARLRGCAVLRAFQVTGTIPAIAARARFGVPYVTTYGFSYAQLSRRGPKRLLKAAVERVGLRRAAAVIAAARACSRSAPSSGPAPTSTSLSGVRRATSAAAATSVWRFFSAENRPT